MSGFLQNLLARLSDDVEIELSREFVTFRIGDRSRRVKAVVYLANDGERTRFLAVGEASALTQAHVEVKLFDPASQPPPSVTKGECLEAFFRSVLIDLSSRWAIIRPRMIVTGIETVAPILGGYHEDILREALEGTGAREVQFTRAGPAR